MLGRKPFCPFADKVDMRTLLKHQPRSLDRVGQMLHTRHAACLQVRTRHQQRIKLHSTIVRQKRTASGVEGLVIFHHDDSSLYRLNRCPAALQHSVTGVECMSDSVFMGRNFIVRHRPGTAVDQQGWGVGLAKLHLQLIVRKHTQQLIRTGWVHPKMLPPHQRCMRR